MQEIAFKIDRRIHSVLSFVLMFLILFIVFLSSLGTVLRWLENSWLWLDPFVRHLVFATTFLGAAYAVGKAQHIRIDLLSRFLESKKLDNISNLLSRTLSLISGIVCFILAKSGYDFALIQYKYGQDAFLGLSSGDLVTIIPIGMILIGIRFILMSIHNQKLTE